MVSAWSPGASGLLVVSSLCPRYFFKMLIVLLALVVVVGLVAVTVMVLVILGILVVVLL